MSPEGQFEFAIGMIEDITQRKQAEEQLKQSEERFRSLIENALDVIVIIAEDGTIKYESPSINKVLGYTAENLIGEDGCAVAPGNGRVEPLLESLAIEDVVSQDEGNVIVAHEVLPDDKRLGEPFRLRLDVVGK